MFKTVKRIIDWCGEFKGKLYLGFIFSFFSYWFAAMPVMVAAYTIGMLLDAERGAGTFDRAWIWKSLVIMGVFVFLRFLFDYLRARCQEAISYELIARDRLAVGDALKRVSLGYFAQMNTGNILNSITTGLGTLESMGIRMIDNFVGGYLNFLCIFLFLLFFNPVVSLIALAGAFASFLCLLLVSKHSVKHAPAEAEAGRNLAGAVLEYARGISVVKSFGKSGASMEAMQKACRDSRDIRLAIEWGFTPANCLHLLALKCASVALAAEACFLGFRGEMEFPVMLMFVFFSFGIFSSITDAANPVEYIKFENGKEIYQDINYVVAANQTLTVNTQASAVFDASIGRDVDAMIEAVKFAQDANNKVEELEKMQKMQEYSSDDCQAALEDWIAAAKKERDYADDNLQKLYNSYIGNFDDYLQKVNLANTDLGSKGQSLDLTKNRMANQQTTMEELKSTNEDRDLSEIIIDYTSAYTAYQASLQAAAKINQTTLLNYI